MRIFKQHYDYQQIRNDYNNIISNQPALKLVKFAKKTSSDEA